VDEIIIVLLTTNTSSQRHLRAAVVAVEGRGVRGVEGAPRAALLRLPPRGDQTALTHAHTHALAHTPAHGLTSRFRPDILSTVLMPAGVFLNRWQAGGCARDRACCFLHADPSYAESVAYG